MPQASTPSQKPESAATQLSIVDYDPHAGWVTPLEGLQYPNVEFADRLRTLRNTQGFMPTSLGEGNEGFALLSYMQTPGGAARHLNEILLHQKKAITAEPEAAVRSVTTEYAGYAQRARTDTTALVALRQELTDRTDVNPLTSLRELQIQNGVRQLTRFIDLTKLANGQALTIDPFTIRTDKRRSALDPYIITTPSQDMLAHIDETIGNIRLWQARNLVGPAVADQVNRRAFWTDRLQETRKHIVARPIAVNALRNLGVKVDSVAN